MQLMYDSNTNIAYVKKVRDEMTKNHKECNKEIYIGFMPQILDANGRPHHLCPVRSFENYFNKLNPKLDDLWQIPLNNFSKDQTKPWYKAERLGHNTLEKFMGRLSDRNNLSEDYTNHCIRVTGATNLTIMSITGHKSIESLAIYQCVQEDEKLKMGMSLMFNLFKPNEAQKI